MTEHSKQNSHFVSFSAVDTLMFRDGRPFNQADAGASRAVSVFPPHPPTLVGAVRAALWRASRAWNKDLLGDGTNWQEEKTSLGKLRFGPPTIMREKKQNSTLESNKKKEPLFPVPLHILGKTKDKNLELTWLEPGKPRNCDLGENVLLPELHKPLEGAKPLTDYMVTLEGLEKIIKGELPDAHQFVKISNLWQDEPRVGIGLDATSRAVVKSELYMANHIRLRDGVSIGLEVQGAGEITPGLIPLAGEHRMAQLEVIKDKDWKLPSPPQNAHNGRYCLIQLSPLVLNEMPQPGKYFLNFPGTLETACLGKPVPIGGWDSVNKRAIPLRLAIPAGSVWFMQLGENEELKWPDHMNTGHDIGKDWGFGHFIAAKLMGE